MHRVTTPEGRKRLSEKMKERNASPEFRKASAERGRRLLSDPEFHARRVAAMYSEQQPANAVKLPLGTLDPEI